MCKVATLQVQIQPHLTSHELRSTHSFHLRRYDETFLHEDRGMEKCNYRRVNDKSKAARLHAKRCGQLAYLTNYISLETAPTAFFHICDISKFNNAC